MDLSCLILALVVPVLTYCCLKRIHNYWQSQNVPSIPNPNIIFGHMLPAITCKENLVQMVDSVYKSFGSSVVGFYFMRRPGVIVRDPELIKSVLQTNFSSFRDRMVQLSEKNDPVLAKHPFFASDHDVWRERRGKVSNNLTSKKLKSLSVIVQGVCDDMCAFVERKIRENGESYECDLKNLFTRFTGEVVANAAFGIQGQSFEDNPDRLSYSEVVKTLFEPSLINAIKIVLLFFLPGIASFFGLSFMEKKADQYMRQNVKAILKKRRETGETPNDYLQFSSESNEDIDDIISDLVNFHADVYETTSSAIANLFYSLSQNLEIQQKLRDHVKFALKESNEQMTYESLKNLSYLDQVLNESLRIIPPGGVLLKCCSEEITLKGSDGIDCHLKPGNPVFIPIIGLHHDEKYWPNPEVFDPDRFSLENQTVNNKYAFLPFGEGPRMCVGMRLALMLVKQAAVTLIVKFSIEHSPKTKVPLEIDPNSFLLGAYSYKGGLWGRFRKINPK